MLCRTTLNYGDGSIDVEIDDGRTADLPGWEESGFELRSHASGVSDWSDEADVARVHYEELAALAREMTGCDEAIVNRHIRRNPDEARKHSDLAPIALVHSDFADSYGDVLRAREEAAASARRLLILQFWRNLGPEKMDLPLAWCDARTVPPEQLRPFPVRNYAGEGFDFDALAFAPPAEAGAHHWYAFDRLRDDEVVCFRTYDSDRVADGRPYWTPHSAFRDPEVELGRPSRSSIEVRATCVWR